MRASTCLWIGTDLSASNLMAGPLGGFAHHATMEFAEVLYRQRKSDLVVGNVCFALSAIHWPPLGSFTVRVVAKAHYLSYLLNCWDLRCLGLGYHSVGDKFVDAAHRSPKPFCSFTRVLAATKKSVCQESGNAGLTITGNMIWGQVLARCNGVLSGFASPKTWLLRG